MDYSSIDISSISATRKTKHTTLDKHELKIPHDYGDKHSVEKLIKRSHSNGSYICKYVYMYTSKYTLWCIDFISNDHDIIMYLFWPAAFVMYYNFMQTDSSIYIYIYAHKINYPKQQLQNKSLKSQSDAIWLAKDKAYHCFWPMCEYWLFPLPFGATLRDHNTQAQARPQMIATKPTLMNKPTGPRPNWATGSG